MGSAVGAQKETPRPAGGRCQMGLPVFFALEHRQAIPMRAYAALEQGIAVIQQMMRGNGGSHRAIGRSEEHTSELQSLMRISYAVFCLKNKTSNTPPPQKYNHR